MKNSEALKEILRSAVTGMSEVISADLDLVSYDDVTKRSWEKAAGGVRKLLEAVELLDLIVNIDKELDVDSMPEISRNAINSYSVSFGNRCFFQRNELKRWLDKGDKEELDDYRFDLDWVTNEE